MATAMGTAVFSPPSPTSGETVAARPNCRAPTIADRTGAPIFLHLDDRLLWKHTHPDRDPDGYLSDGRRLTIAGTELTVLHTH